MANPTVKTRLARIDSELQALRIHVQQYSDVPKANARAIDDLATSIAICSTEIAEAARRAMGERVPHGKLWRSVRKALGFTHP